MLWWLTQHLATTALLCALVWLTCRLARPGPAIKNLLWLVVLLKLLTPPLFSWSLPDYFAEAAPTTPAPAPPPTYVFPPLHTPTFAVPPDKQGSYASKDPTSDDPPLKKPEARNDSEAHEADAGITGEQPPSQPAFAHVVPAQHASLSIPWVTLVVCTWIVLALAMLVVQVRRIARFQRQAQSSEPAPRWLVRMVRELAAKLDVAAPGVRIVEGLGSPAIWSLGRPELLWPVGLLVRLDGDKCRGIVVHELAHLRRRDHWVARLLLFAECVWWWNPLFWLIRRELRHSAEWACDAWVVWALPEQRRAYAETLIEVSRVTTPVTLPAPALGIGGARQAFQRRLTMIMCERIPCRVSRWAFIVIGLAALAVLPGWAQAQTREIQDTVDARLRAEFLKQSLTALEEQKKKLEAEIEVLKKHIDALKEQGAAIDGAEGRIKELQSVIADYRDRLAVVQQERERVLKPQPTSSGRAIDDLLVAKWVDATVSDKRAWGPEQATGAPDCGEAAGDNQRAWASKTEDEQDEWLRVSYDKPVRPMAILVYENYNPGALYKVSVFTSTGGQSLESEIWKGKDPTPPGSGWGVSIIPVKWDQPINAVQLYLHSPQVKGWNEIDAVGLLDAEGKIHWASRAEASSSYADRESSAEGLARYLSGRTVVGDRFTAARRAQDDQRLDRLEKDVKELKDMLQKLMGGSEASGGSKPLGTRVDTDAEIRRLLKENQEVQQRLKDLEQRSRKPQ
jgi:beta-lactamase regulating signal transducer with metallopeptidase domain